MEDRPHVLIVEDEPDLAELYATWLAGHATTETASDGTTALEVIDEDVDVVLLDRRIPRVSGDEVLETIRERGHDCHVAMVTAVEPGFGIVGMEFDDYLVKPVSKDELRDLIERLLLHSSYDEQLREYFSLSSKKALLDAEKSEAERRASREYARLKDQLAVLRTEVDETFLELLEEGDSRELCRNLTRCADGEDRGD
ncbi:HalX domain-containing protein [Natrialbaceae archaeon A-gly3]